MCRLTNLYSVISEILDLLPANTKIMAIDRFVDGQSAISRFLGGWMSQSRMRMSHVTHMNGSCHACEWVMSHMWMRHDTHVNVKSHHTYLITRRLGSRNVNESRHTCKYVMSHMWISHDVKMGSVIHVNESCHTFEWFMPHMWISNVTHVDESYYTCEYVMSHVWKSHATHANVSSHTCEWVMTCVCVMSHMWISNVTRLNESHHTCECVISHVWTSRFVAWKGVMSHMWKNMTRRQFGSAWAAVRVRAQQCEFVSSSSSSCSTHVKTSCHCCDYIMSHM